MLIGFDFHRFLCGSGLFDLLPKKPFRGKFTYRNYQVKTQNYLKLCGNFNLKGKVNFDFVPVLIIFEKTNSHFTKSNLYHLPG